MSDTSKPIIAGTVISTDITVENASELKDFYAEVIGWQVEEMQLSDEGGAYADYVMKDQAGNWAAGVCHRRGVNADLPQGWIVYVAVADISKSIEAATRLGGLVLKEQKDAEGNYYYAMIQDPTGAVLALTKAG
jgi:uncharacterized protein